MGVYKLTKIDEQSKSRKGPRNKQSVLGTQGRAGFGLEEVSTDRHVHQCEEHKATYAWAWDGESLKENAGLKGDLCEFKY